VTIAEAKLCVEFFTERMHGEIPDTDIATARIILKKACDHFPGIIGGIEPNEMEKLFKFFRAVIVRLAIEELGEELAEVLSNELGLDVVVVMAEFQREFIENDNIPQLSPEEEERFQGLIKKLKLHEE